MIARLRGTLAEKSPGEVLVDVGGVGYQAQIPLSTFYRLPEEGSEVELQVVTNLRENALELFAFRSAEEKQLFSTLRSITGIGPRVALAILSGTEPEEFRRVVRDGDLTRLVAIPGIGRKTAERLLVELKDKLSGDAEGDLGADSLGEDAVLALVALGYKRGQASNAVKALLPEAGGSVETLIKKSLARLS